MVVTSGVLWVGVPFGWLWVGSQVQAETDSLGVAEPEVAGVRVVLVDTRLDQPQPEQVAIEGRRPLEVAADQRDVMNARDAQAAFFRSQG